MKPSETEELRRRCAVLASALSDKERQVTELLLFRELVDKTTDAILVIDPESGRFIDVNKSACQLLGFTPAELLAKGLRDLGAEGQPAPPWEEQVRIARERGSLVWNEEIRRKDGTPIPAETILQFALREGRGYLVAVMRDLTARRMEGKLMESILQNVGEGFIVVDRDFRVLSANRAYCEMVKRPVAEVTGRRCYEISHRGTRPCFQNGELCPVRETFLNQRPQVVTHLHRDGNGASRWVEVKSFPIRDASGAVGHVIEVLNDITEQRRLEEQLLKSQRMEAVGQLAGGVAHDFNNILTAIQGSCSLMEYKIEPSSPLRRHVGEIMSASDRAAKLTRSLLAFSRKQVMHTEPTDLNAVIGGLQHLLSRLIGEDIELEITLAPEPLIIEADSGQIEQVLMNLAANARDALPEGGRIQIRLQEVVLDEQSLARLGYGRVGAYACLTFADDGAGMDEVTRARIFEPFFTTKSVDRGTGLGLSTVYGIVRQHNAQIDVESVRGAGSTFRIWFPLIRERPQESAPALPEGRLTGNETILVVEDDETIVTLVRSVLQLHGYTVLLARDGEEALREFTAAMREIDLVLTDVVLPKLSGINLCEKVRLLKPGIKVLLCSGYSPDLLRVRSACPDPHPNFIAKPFTPEELLRLLRRLLDARP